MRDALDRRAEHLVSQGLAERQNRSVSFGRNLIDTQRFDLSSGRFAMLDDGLGFQLVPWSPSLERHLGRHIWRRGDFGVDWAASEDSVSRHHQRGLGAFDATETRPPAHSSLTRGA